LSTKCAVTYFWDSLEKDKSANNEFFSLYKKITISNRNSTQIVYLLEILRRPIKL